MKVQPIRQSGGCRDDARPHADANPHGELAAILDDLELQVQEDMMMLDDPTVRLLAPSLMALIRNSTDDLGDALARTRQTLAAAEAKAARPGNPLA